MKRFQIITVCLVALLFATTALSAQQTKTAKDNEQDASNRKVETPVANVVSNSSKLENLDRGKMLVELPLKKIVGESKGEIPAETSTVLAPKFASKAFIEAPTKRLLGDDGFNLRIPLEQDGNADTGKEHDTSNSAAEDSENPKVKPGLVKWHPDMETACKAARESGKPVLLFQLLGQLDQRFT